MRVRCSVELDGIATVVYGGSIKSQHCEDRHGRRTDGPVQLYALSCISPAISHCLPSASLSALSSLHHLPSIEYGGCPLTQERGRTSQGRHSAGKVSHSMSV